MPVLAPAEVTVQESSSMKLRLMQRKLIINKITCVTAITDNNCVKETTSEICVWERDSALLAEQIVRLIYREQASQGQRSKPDKESIIHFEYIFLPAMIIPACGNTWL